MEECRSFAPNEGKEPKILILGSIPGAESLHKQEYYAHARNAFWRIMGTVYGFDAQLPYPNRLAELARNEIALWDVLESCRRIGSLDSAIREAHPNDIPGFLKRNPGIVRILCNGGTAFRALRKFFPSLAADIRQLPSTSPAAALYSYEAKLDLWREALLQKPAAVPLGEKLIQNSVPPIEEDR